MIFQEAMEFRCSEPFIINGATRNRFNNRRSTGLEQAQRGKEKQEMRLERSSGPDAEGRGLGFELEAKGEVRRYGSQGGIIGLDQGGHWEVGRRGWI